jgi:hypothetical protein
MPNISLAAILFSLIFQGLTFNAPHTWFFTGLVMETRQVRVIGLQARVARVQSAGFDAWVILRTASQSHELPDIVLGEASSGDLVRVSISGPHVSETAVDWDICQPMYSNYCRQGWLYDSGPLSGDWNIPLSPSNEFIHSGNTNLSIAYPLFWNIEVLKDAAALKREACTRRTGPQAGGANPCIGSDAAPRFPPGVCRLAGQEHGRICPVPR